MTLQQLRDFIAVADAGSLRAAARLRGVTGPALAKSVKALEDEMHVLLLERRSRGTALTSYGEALLAHARLIDSQARQATEDIAQRRGSVEGSVTIGVGPSPGVALMPDVLRDFQRQHPTVRLSMLGGAYYDHIAAIRRGQMDFSIVAVPEGKLEPGLHAEHLFYNDLVVVCRKGHPMSRARTLAELGDCQWITGPTDEGPGAAILAAFRQQGLPLPRRILHCDITWTLHNLLVCTDALFALPRLMLEQPGLCTALQALDVAAVLPHYSISLVRRADAPLLPMADFLATLVRRHAHYLVHPRGDPAAPVSA